MCRQSDRHPVYLGMYHLKDCLGEILRVNCRDQLYSLPALQALGVVWEGRYAKARAYLANQHCR